MRPRISVITIGVDDLERALRFYRDGLGLRTPGIVGQEFEHGAVAFFDLRGYAGYFKDPDGHLWEVGWNPQLLPED